MATYSYSVQFVAKAEAAGRTIIETGLSFDPNLYIISVSCSSQTILVCHSSPTASVNSTGSEITVVSYATSAARFPIDETINADITMTVTIGPCHYYSWPTGSTVYPSLDLTDITRISAETSSVNDNGSAFWSTTSASTGFYTGSSTSTELDLVNFLGAYPAYKPYQKIAGSSYIGSGYYGSSGNEISFIARGYMPKPFSLTAINDSTYFLDNIDKAKLLGGWIQSGTADSQIIVSRHLDDSSHAYIVVYNVATEQTQYYSRYSSVVIDGTTLAANNIFLSLTDVPSCLTIVICGGGGGGAGYTQYYMCDGSGSDPHNPWYSSSCTGGGGGSGAYGIFVLNFGIAEYFNITLGHYGTGGVFRAAGFLDPHSDATFRAQFKADCDGGSGGDSIIKAYKKGSVIQTVTLGGGTGGSFSFPTAYAKSECDGGRYGSITSSGPETTAITTITYDNGRWGGPGKSIKFPIYGAFYTYPDVGDGYSGNSRSTLSGTIYSYGSYSYYTKITKTLSSGSGGTYNDAGGSGGGASIGNGGDPHNVGALGGGGGGGYLIKDTMAITDECNGSTGGRGACWLLY